MLSDCLAAPDSYRDGMTSPGLIEFFCYVTFILNFSIVNLSILTKRYFYCINHLSSLWIQEEIFEESIGTGRWCRFVACIAGITGKGTCH